MLQTMIRKANVYNAFCNKYDMCYLYSRKRKRIKNGKHMSSLNKYYLLYYKTKEKELISVVLLNTKRFTDRQTD